LADALAEAGVTSVGELAHVNPSSAQCRYLYPVPSRHRQWCCDRSRQRSERRSISTRSITPIFPRLPPCDQHRACRSSASAYN
jgi:hypothetical protein